MESKSMINAVLNNRRAIALIMAVAIMALLAVIGFGFMATAKVESDVASNISMVTHARMAAQAAVQMAPGLLLKDAMTCARHGCGSAGRPPVGNHVRRNSK
jgi:Tfp pilus assembly protein PilX